MKTTSKMEDEQKNKTPKIGSRDTSVGWYIPTLEKITFRQRDLLEGYSKIPHDLVIPNILKLVCVLHFIIFPLFRRYDQSTSGSVLNGRKLRSHCRESILQT